MLLSRLGCITQRSITRDIVQRCSTGNCYNNHRLPFLTRCDQRHSLTTSPNHWEKLSTKPVQKYDLNYVLSEAEKIVAYPTSLLSLRWLLSDEIANVAIHLRKLAGSTHPLLKTAQHLLYNGKIHMQAWGLIILLLAKAAGQAAHLLDTERDKNSGVLHSQLALAEISEMFRVGHLIHLNVVNLQPLMQAGNDLSMHGEMTFGNKIALLSGDYVLSISCSELARLRNQEIVELMMSAVRDLAESEFIGDRDEQNNPLPSKPMPHRESTSEDVEDDDCVQSDLLKPIRKHGCMGIPEKEWALRHILSAGSLLSKSCQAALKLAGQPEAIQKSGFLYGKHFSLAWQACLDLEPFQSETLPLNATFSLVSAPVLFHLNYDPSLYTEIQKGYVSIENINYQKIHSEVINGPGLEKTKILQQKHCLAAMEALSLFPPSDACTTLRKIIFAMQELRTLKIKESV